MVSDFFDEVGGIKWRSWKRFGEANLGKGEGMHYGRATARRRIHAQDSGRGLRREGLPTPRAGPRRKTCPSVGCFGRDVFVPAKLSILSLTLVKFFDPGGGQQGGVFLLLARMDGTPESVGSRVRRYLLEVSCSPSATHSPQERSKTCILGLETFVHASPRRVMSDGDWHSKNRIRFATCNREKKLKKLTQAELERVRAENRQLEEDFNAVLLGLKVCPEVVEGAAARLSVEGTAATRFASVRILSSHPQGGKLTARLSKRHSTASDLPSRRRIDRSGTADQQGRRSKAPGTARWQTASCSPPRPRSTPQAPTATTSSSIRPPGVRWCSTSRNEITLQRERRPLRSTRRERA
jgi:hypothetical protein